MGKVDRFDTVPNCEHGWAEKCEEGAYVLYTDYTKLQAEVAALAEWKQLLLAHPLGEAVVELEAEVERLEAAATHYLDTSDLTPSEREKRRENLREALEGKDDD